MYFYFMGDNNISFLSVSAAKSSEYAVVVVGSYSHEGSDRTTLGLGSEQDALVSAVCGANKNTIVALHSPAASLTPFKSQCAAILNQGYPGQEDGNALARVIFGGEHKQTFKLFSCNSFF